MTLPEDTREVILGVPSSDLLRGGLEILCWSFVMVQLGIQEREHHADEISWLEHKVAEGVEHLKQALAANSEFLEMIAREAAERELAQQEVAEAGLRLREMKAEMARVVVENTNLKRMVEERDEKLSSSATELANLQSAKDEAEEELDRNFEQTEELLKGSFVRVVHQAHVLYGGSSTSGAFDLDHEVYQGQIMPIAEMRALAAQEAGPTEGNKDEGNQE